jgi:hypothetical protein
MSFPVRLSPCWGFMSPLHFPPTSLLSLKPLIPTRPHSTLARFNGAEDDTFHGIFHESTDEDKGKELMFWGFRSLLPIDAEDIKVSPLHVIFDLKGVLVGKDYFKINDLLLLPFNLAWGCTLLSKSIVPMLVLKEFLLRCLKQFTVYL